MIGATVFVSMISTRDGIFSGVTLAKFRLRTMSSLALKVCTAIAGLKYL
jgi:hypothetical protein